MKLITALVARWRQCKLAYAEVDAKADLVVIDPAAGSSAKLKGWRMSIRVKRMLILALMLVAGMGLITAMSTGYDRRSHFYSRAAALLLVAGILAAFLGYQPSGNLHIFASESTSPRTAEIAGGL